MTAYVDGNKVRLTVKFWDDNGALVDSPTFDLKIEDPAGSVTTYSYPGYDITKDSTGTYHHDLIVNLPGRWFYQVESTGTIIAVAYNAFLVEPQVI